MSYFNNLTLTTKGQEMLLSSNTNIDKIITFTNASLGSEKLLPEEIKGATEIKNSWLKFPLNSVRIIDDESNYFLRTEIAFTNAGITESKIMQELGIYAKFENEEEVLFAYSTTDDDGETIPKEDIVPATYKFTIDTTISTETKINQVINPDGFLTKEVIELLKENIRNIAFRKIQGTLTTNQKVIQVPTDILLPISQRVILNIEGEIYFLGRDYTIDIHANTITLNDRYNFKDGTQYEIIDPLPATYVKEQIQEFIEEFKKLVNDSKIDFDKFKDKIYLEFQEKVDAFYLQLDKYIEENKENLKGHSVDRVVENGKDSQGGNIYDIFRDDNKKIGTMIAPRGLRGNGIVNPEYVGLTENGDTRYVLVLEDGTKTTEEMISPKGQNGTPFYFAKIYPSIVDMEVDFETENVDFGEYVVISSDDSDNAKLFEKRTEGFIFIIQIAMRGKGLYDYWLELGNKGTLEEFMNSMKPNYTSKFLNEQANGDRNYGWFDSEGNQVGTYTARGGKDGKQGIPGLNWDGTRPEYPDIPVGVPYGTLFELAPGALPTSGWVFANGETLPKGKYPHLVGVAGFESRQVPETSDIDIDDAPYFDNKLTENGVEYWKGETRNKKVILLKEFRRSGDAHTSGGGGRNVYANYIDYYGGIYPQYGQMLALNYGADTEQRDFIEVRFNENYYLHRFSFYKQTSKTSNDRFYIQVKSGELWTTAAELNPSTDFLPDLDRGIKGSYFYIDLKKYNLSTNNFRIVSYNLSTYYQNFCGFRLYAGAQELQYKEIVTLPLAKTEDRRFKIVYVGQPVAETEEPTMYSYSKEKESNGEIPFSLAADNKLPYYVEGITMSEPREAKIGYTNKYDTKTDTWELVKTCENEDGCYYDLNGDLKHIPKPSNWVKWDNINNIWIEDTILKEKAKKELLNKYIELEIKKDKMIDLKLDIISIVEEIEIIKKNLEELNG